MLSRFYGRVLVVVSVGIAFIWFSFGYFGEGQYWDEGEVIEDHRYTKPIPRHLYKRNGLLEVNYEGPHPIFELMERGESLWNAKLARQSKTFPQAVREYKKRYRRDPPLGFDKWWEYAEKHDVQLRDEYDQIWMSLEPFWAFSPARLDKLRLDAMQNHLDLFTLSKLPGKNITAIGGERFPHAIGNQMGLLEDIQEFLPPFNVTYSPHDSPFQLADHEWRKKGTLMAAVKKVIPDDEVTPRGDLHGWIAACSPNTLYRPLSPSSPDTGIPTAPPKKTFIFDHKVARDPCQHPPPSLFPISGLYALHKPPGPETTIDVSPVFSVCGTTLHADIIAPTLYLWESEIWPGDPPFNQKTDDRLFWRGSNTGSLFLNKDQHLLTQSHRTRLVRLTSQLPPPENATITILPSTPSRTDPVGNGLPHKLVDVNQASMNVSFAGKPLQCEEPTCTKLSEIYHFGNYIDDIQSSEFKYVIDVDGNGWSGRFKRMMTNHALIFKSTIFLEWLTDRVMPWVHYVPIQPDYSDLYDALFFFRGDESNPQGHPELAEKIVNAGREWSLKFWRKEDMTAYIFRLYLEYARIMSPDRDEQMFQL